MSQAIPLVNSAQLAERQSEEVRLIGKVLKVCQRRLTDRFPVISFFLRPLTMAR